MEAGEQWEVFNGRLMAGCDGEAGDGMRGSGEVFEALFRRLAAPT